MPYFSTVYCPGERTCGIDWTSQKIDEYRRDRSLHRRAGRIEEPTQLTYVQSFVHAQSFYGYIHLYIDLSERLSIFFLTLYKHT